METKRREEDGMGWEGDAEGQSHSPILQAAFPGFAISGFPA